MLRMPNQYFSAFDSYSLEFHLEDVLLGSLVLLGIAYSLVLAAFGLAVLLSKLHRLGDLRKIEALGVTGWRCDMWWIWHLFKYVNTCNYVYHVFVYFMHLYSRSTVYVFISYWFVFIFMSELQLFCAQRYIFATIFEHVSEIIYRYMQCIRVRIFVLSDGRSAKQLEGEQTSKSCIAKSQEVTFGARSQKLLFAQRVKQSLL